jgi:hypothetical protein
MMLRRMLMMQQQRVLKVVESLSALSIFDEFGKEFICWVVSSI